MQRTVLARHELDWLPPSYRAIRWTVAGGIWTGLFGALVGALAMAHVNVFFFGKGLAVMAAGGYVAGDRAARRVLRARLRKLAQGAVDLTRLPAEPDGELVHVVGRVRALSGRPQVFRRRVFQFDGDTQRVVHETADDFWIVADGSEPVLVETTEARLLAADPGGTWHSEDGTVRELEALALPPSLESTMARRRKRRDKGKSPGRVRVSEVLVRDGDTVEVLGYKSRTIDPTVAARLERDTPYRATLKSGQALPLLIAPTS